MGWELETPTVQFAHVTRRYLNYPSTSDLLGLNSKPKLTTGSVCDFVTTMRPYYFNSVKARYMLPCLNNCMVWFIGSCCLLRKTLNLRNSLGGRGQVIGSVLGDMHIVLNAHTTNAPITVQNLGVDVLAQLGRLQDGVDNEAAEVNL